MYIKIRKDIRKYRSLLNKKFYLILIFSICIPELITAQDPEFSQFYAVPLYLNPALAGTGNSSRIILIYRDQWSLISRAYITYAVSFDQYINKINGSVGILFTGDRACNGIVVTNGFSAIYAYRINLNNFNVQAGVQASFFQKRVNWSELVFGDMLDPRYGLINISTNEIIPNEPSVLYADFSFGLVGYNENIFGGFSIKHLAQPNVSFSDNSYASKIPLRFTIHAGTIMHFNKNHQRESFLSPDILYTQQNIFKQLNLGLYWSKSFFLAGFRIRHTFNNSDALIPLIGFRKKFYKITYSYDITISSLSVARTGGSHELSVEMQFNPKVNKSKIKCARF